MPRKMKDAAVQQAPDDTALAADTPTVESTATESKRKAVSKRDYLDVDGKVVDRIEEATGARYTLLDPAGNHDFDEQSGLPAGSFVTMAFIMGYHTKVGNVANTVLNDKDEPGTPADAAAAIREWLAAAKSPDNPTWAERSGGGGGARIDRDAFADSMTACQLASGKVKPEDEAAYRAKVRQRMEDEKGFLTAAMKITEFAQEYARRTGKPQKTMADFL